MGLNRNVSGTSQKIFHVDPHGFQGIQIGDPFTDVTVQVGAVSMRCHKRVLENLSSFFKRKFTTSLIGNNADVVNIEGVEQRSISSLIEMAYSTQLVVDVNNIEDIVMAADFLLMKKLKLFCEEMLIEQLDNTNVFRFHHLGDRLCLSSLFTIADKFIVNIFAKSTTTEGFLSLGKDKVVALISRSDLQVKLEEDIFESCKFWIEDCHKNRKDSIFELLQKVRLVVIEPNFLVNVIANYQACRNHTGCQKLISNAKRYHVKPSTSSELNVGETKPRGFLSGKVYIIERSTVNLLSGNGFYDKVGMISSHVSETHTHVLGSSCTTIDGKIYLTGGWYVDRYTEAFVITNEVHVYSPADDISTLLEPMNYSRECHGCASHAGALFACGGIDEEPFKCCEKLIIGDNNWTFVANMNAERRCFPLVSCGKFLWAIGGGNNVHVALNTTEYFNNITNKWTNSSPMQQKRLSHSAVAFRETIFVI